MRFSSKNCTSSVWAWAATSTRILFSLFFPSLDVFFLFLAGSPTFGGCFTGFERVWFFLFIYGFLLWNNHRKLVFQACTQGVVIFGLMHTWSRLILLTKVGLVGVFQLRNLHHISWVHKRASVANVVWAGKSLKAFAANSVFSLFLRFLGLSTERWLSAHTRPLLVFVSHALSIRDCLAKLFFHLFVFDYSVSEFVFNVYVRSL